jgi:hypothetical protein
MYFYYYEEEREPADEVVETFENNSEKKPIKISLLYFDQVIDE